MKRITFEDIKENKEFNTYIQKGNELLGVLGYTEHSHAHVKKVSDTAANILLELGYDKRTVELAKISGYIHDIGNVINRVEHAQSGAVMAFVILSKMEMDPCEIATVVGAIGNHDEDAGIPVSPVCAALILADKTDVRRSRVRNKDFAKFDIHDRVNYAVENSKLIVHSKEKAICLEMSIDTSICSVMDYFEIFLARMMMCRRAADFLGVKFDLMANDVKLI